LCPSLVYAQKKSIGKQARVKFGEISETSDSNSDMEDIFFISKSGVGINKVAKKQEETFCFCL
jgi:hypothetical protein